MDCEKASTCQPHDMPTASTRQISDLADADLEEIFKRLPPIDRLLVSEVCKRWNDLSRKAWLDITQLDLSPIPAPHISAVIRQCPNLRVVSAVKTTFNHTQLYILSRIPLTSVKLLGCTALILATSVEISDFFSAVFSSALREAAWEELVLHDLNIQVEVAPGGSPVSKVEFPASFPTSLKRLQICQMNITGALEANCDGLLAGVAQLQQLECLMAYGRNAWTKAGVYKYLQAAVLDSLQNLRELHLSNEYASSHRVTRYETRLVSIWPLLIGLPKLEVLFLNCDILMDEKFCQLLTKHPALRILVVTGKCERHFALGTTPRRVLYANGLGSTPLPILHVFLGDVAFETFGFQGFFSDIAKLYRITEPLPLFVDREDIKPIFEGVWIAEKIKEFANKDLDFFYDHDEYSKFLRELERPRSKQELDESFQTWQAYVSGEF